MFKKNSKKMIRIMSIFIAVIMIIGMLPMNVLAKGYDYENDHKDLEIRFWEDEKPDLGFSIKIETGKKFNRKELVAKILNNFEYFYNLLVNEGDISEAIDICRDKSILIGKEVRVIERNNEFERTAIDLNEKGELIVKDDDGNTSVLISGEVSVRGKHGYV